MTSTPLVIPAPDNDRAWNFFVQHLGSDQATGNTIAFENEMAEGVVNVFHHTEHLHIRAWEFSACKGLVLQKRPWPCSSVALLLLYVFNPEFFLLRQNGYNLQANKPNAPLLLLIPPSVAMQFEIASYHKIQLLEIGLTNDFFLHWQTGQFLLPTSNSFPVIRLKMCSVVVVNYLNQLFGLAMKQEMESEKTRSLIKSLTDKLQTDFINSPVVSDQASADIHIDKLKQVEQRIVKNVRKPLPLLSELAGEVNLSEATLKRHFKIVFGLGIYQYYLSRKMQLARMILEEGNISVSSLTEEMGYQKVSHFIKLFKKYHGYAPGSVIRSQKYNTEG